METWDNTATANPIAPLESLRGSPVLPQITANTDVEAVSAWLAEYQESPQTWKCYRREAERLLLWLTTQRLTLDQVNRDVLRHFEAFLADPQPSAQWVGPTKPRHHPQWRPFRGGLSAASRRQSLIILQGLFSWLVEAGWVRHNPFRLMRDKSRRLNNQTPRIERYLERELWEWLWQWLNQPVAGQGERAIYESARRRFIFGFAYLLAPRLSEMADARMGDFQQSEGRWWWSVVGKGNKVARIPLPADMQNCLIEWRLALGLTGLPTHHDDAPVIRALDKQRSVGHNQLYRLIRDTFKEAADTLQAADGNSAHIAALRKATPHWLRHTSITHQAQAGISLRHLADSARHSRLDTTARYLHNEAIEWHHEQQRHQIMPRSPQDNIETL
ncbi:tyrosine-type recombinase/integrase [Halomonas sp. HL-93]|uniref:tyrosine-type recombinase/integrase n=1 Tax=Halomonas sp. HL-93 TaxID=1666906 RepID=UPI0006DAABA2|nr:site-specific integrase [Halomonas sp. HL-93]KPQ19788.1 MAG: phage integrase family protein [Halomonas sp. HL-93]SBR48801.1 Site-specific recombinase XerC [Halomonas sp. HL-93]